MAGGNGRGSPTCSSEVQFPVGERNTEIESGHSGTMAEEKVTREDGGVTVMTEVRVG